MAEPHKEEVTVGESVFTNLEYDFNDAMKALEGEDALGHFRLEYEKLYSALKQSHDSEKMLVSHCQELTQELLSNAAKMQAAVKLSKGDHSTIEALKKEVEKAWRAVDSANDKDLRARETVKSLKGEIQTLRGMIQEGGAFSTDHASTLEELKLENRRLQLETEEMSKQVDIFSKELAEMTVSHRKCEANLVSNREETQRLTDRFELVRQEHRRERNARERAEYQARELLMVLKTKENDLQGLQKQLAELESAATVLSTQINEQQQKKQSLQKKLETAELQLFHTQQSYNDSVDTTSDLTEKIHAKELQISKTEKSVIEFHNEKDRMERMKDHDFKEYSRLQHQISTIRVEHESLQYEKQTLEKRKVALEKEKQSLQAALLLVTKERESLEKVGAKELLKREAMEKLLKQEALNQKDVEDNIRHEDEITARLKAQIEHLERSREKVVSEVSQIAVQNSGAGDELKLAQISVEEMQRKIEAKDAKLDEQQARYEQIRSERNQFSRKLVEAQDEIVELKQKFKLMDHQITQFKEELRLKDRKYTEELAKEKAGKERLKKSRKLVSDHTISFDAAKLQSETVQQQIRQLVKIVSVNDKELSERQKDVLKLITERDLLGTQLIRRNDELALLYEKMRLQQEATVNGEAALHSRVEDVRLLRLKTAEIKRQARLAINRSNMIEEIKNNIKDVDQQLQNEKARTQALAEEIQDPKNLSRWRAIEGKDPSQEELEEKMAQLQKRLITKSEESLEQEMTLQEKERLVAELSGILARQPGPQVAAKLNSYQKDLQKKNTKMKQKASELNMTSTHIEELKYEAERLRRELHDTKRKYYEIKMKNDILQNASAAPS
ncbi:flagellar associated protein [Strigomonas culicis]|uniref:Flagellar associated protein n=1 Tax=Strigomonas culicis TaxID=28005 RepID=S9TVL5_9TRYP|nr:flagellar associated protein [Strigomonas culicis]|eukprot:EPY20594.1 flagellar associated protein [Strigomonas culicis]